MKNNIHLIQIQYRAVDLPEINWRPDVLSKLNGATKTAIENAFKKNAIIDSTGCVWISIEGIRSILRLGTASKAPIIFADTIEDRFKMFTGNQQYLSGSIIAQLIYENIQGPFSYKKRIYSEYAKLIHDQIVLHDYAKKLRSEAKEDIEASLSKLKSERIKKLKIKYDELTGKKLEVNSHFSHIRSKLMYPQIALFWWNGLIINPSTHKVITKYDINYEKALLKLCEERKWDTKWVKPYSADLVNHGFKPTVLFE